MKRTFLILLTGLLFNASFAQNCDISQSGMAIYNAANTAPITSVDAGQNANFRFSIKNSGTDATCSIPANTVLAAFDFPTLAGNVKPYKYDGPLSFVSGYFTWVYNSVDEVLEGTNTTAIPTGMGDLNILVKVKGNANGKGRSNLNLTQGKGLADNSGNNYSGVQLEVTNGGLLPIKLAAFSIVAEKCDAVLSWTTVSDETNFSHFIIEYSPDGVTFINIGTVQGKNQATGSDYNFRYNQLSGNGYYRLKQVDKNASFEYSQVVRIITDCKDKAKVLVYPNPVKFDQKLFVNISGTAGKIKGELYDAAGKKVTVYEFANSSNTISVTGLSAGMYTLYVRSDGKVESFKIVVTR
ncbi:MAG: T9SS type A sorting domain-containing protein [Chitinophagaceae bacterium]